ncbi:MAG: TolC family protein [Fimbriimonadaceae bacterium]|nr:TolC family protein [Fimbriimonadaceae bacterium]
MKNLRSLLAAAFVAASAEGFAQTPPIKPQTPDVVVPPALVLPMQPGGVAKTLGVDEAVALALRQLPALISARAGVEGASGRAAQAGSGLNPSFSVSGSANRTDQLRGAGGDQGNLAASVTLQQLLYDFERTRSLAAQGRSDLEASKKGLAALEQGVTLLVRTAYYGWTQNLALVGVSERNVANRKRQLDLAEARLDSGLGAPGDFLRAKTNYADSVLALENARQTALTSQIDLADLLGEDPRTALTPDESALALPAPEVDLNALVARALQNRPEVLQAEARLRSAQYGVTAAKSVNAPRLSAVGTVSGRGETDLGQSQTGTWGLALTWNPFDGGFARGREREARAQLDAVAADLVQVRHDVVGDVSAAFVVLDTALRRLTTAQAQVQMARELLRVSEGRYQGGIGQFLEVTDAQNLLFSAERTLAQTESDVRIAQARLDRAVG